MFLNILETQETSIEQYKDLNRTVSRPVIIYGLAKVHKIVTDALLFFRPILSAMGTPTYKLAKFLAPMLESLTTSGYTTKDFFTFAEELQRFYSKLVMAVPSQEPIYLCVENLFKHRIHVDNLSKDSFLELLTTMFESLISFNQEFYKQHGGVVIGSPLGPTVANVFLCYHEKIWLQSCPSEFKSVIYRKHGDDTFLHFCSKHHIQKFRN